MSSFTLAVEARSEVGKVPMRRMRAAGFVPGVLYGKGTAAQPFKVAEATLQKCLRSAGRSRLIKLESGVKGVDGKHALVREVQTNPVTDRLLHIDLLGVELDQTILVTLPLEFVGVAVGEKAGGVRAIKRYNLTVECRADILPDKIEIDVTGIEIGQSLHVGDITLPTGVKSRTNPRAGVFLVEKQRKEEAPVAAAATAAPAAAGAAKPAEDAKGAAAPKAEAGKGGKK